MTGEKRGRLGVGELLQVVGFLSFSGKGEEDVISGGINQSTPGQFHGWGRGDKLWKGKGGRKKRKGRERPS